jgi:transcriptional regulator with XRE-family HTH domain
MTEFSSRLKAQAKSLKLSNVEISKRSGIPDRTISHLMNGRNEPSLRQLVKLADAFGCSPNELLGFGANVDAGRKTVAMKRLTAAAQSLPASQIEALALQAEGLAAARRQRN